MDRIGQLARLAEVTPDTIRFYEKQQLMEHRMPTEGGFRLYSDKDLQRLRFIRYGRQLGFTLEAIRGLLSIRIEPDHHTCQESKAIVASRLEEVDHVIAELQIIQRSLQRLAQTCCGEQYSSACCSILEALETGNDPQPEACCGKDCNAGQKE